MEIPAGVMADSGVKALWHETNVIISVYVLHQNKHLVLGC